LPLPRAVTVSILEPGKDLPPSASKMERRMKKICIFVGITVFGWIGWWAGSGLGIMTAWVFSGVGSLLGVYVGWRINRDFLS
jgi:hypothetical protein